MFLTFKSQEERREHGGSGFIEFQFCKMPVKSKIESIVTIEIIDHWKLDSLYVSDYEEFFEIYGKYFDCGYYNNMKNGLVDIYGINYYTSECVDSIISKIETEKPEDYPVILEWLNKAKEYNGFYILGV